ncbi:MAG: DUF1080 domain-containing protein [Verrucomicrobiota bacterium]
MQTKPALLALSLALVLPLAAEEEGFLSLFDGESFAGWKIAENPEAFTIQDGAIVANGTRAHAFYVGEGGQANFNQFELRLEVLTLPNSNGGIFIHSAWLEEGWPSGYEIQVCNTQRDWRKSGSLFNIVHNEIPFEDNTWMEYVIRVQKGRIFVSVNDQVLVNYTPQKEASRLLPEGGALSLQAHDPGSTVHYRNLRIKPLD